MTLACPECGCTITAVKDSRPSETRNRRIGTIRRRRICEGCDHRFTTYEIPAAVIEDILEPEDVVGICKELKESATKLWSQADKMLWALGGASRPPVEKEAEYEDSRTGPFN